MEPSQSSLNVEYSETPYEIGGYAPLRDQDTMVVYINDKMINQRAGVRETSCKVRTLQLFGIIGGPVARIPFWNVVADYAGKNRIYGDVLGLCNTLSYGSVISWCYLKIISDFTKPLSPEEQQMISSGLSSGKKTAIKVGVVLLGVFAQIPFAYMSYEYNNKSLLFPISVFVLDSAYPIYSLYLAQAEAIKRKRQSEFEKDLRSLKQEMIACLENYRDFLSNCPKESRNTHLERINAIKIMANANTIDKIKQFFEVILLAQDISEPKKEGCLRRCGRWVAKGIGATLAGAQVIFLGTLSGDAVANREESPVKFYSAAAAVGLCYAYLGLDVMVMTTSKTYDYVINSCLRRNRKNLAESLGSNLRRILLLLGYATTAFAYAGPMQVCEDLYGGNFRLFMEITSVTATILMSLYTISDLIDDITEYNQLKWGDENTKLLIQLDQQIREFLVVIDKCPGRDFIQLAKLIPKSLLDNWRKKHSSDLTRLKNVFDNLDER